MINPPPRWQAHTSKDYDAKLGAQCAALSLEIVTNSVRRQGIIADPRALHAELFSQFTPSDHPEYAGTYRGTPGTALAERRMSADSQLEPGSEFEFVPPAEVAPRMTAMLANTSAMLAENSADGFRQVDCACPYFLLVRQDSSIPGREWTCAARALCGDGNRIWLSALQSLRHPPAPLRPAAGHGAGDIHTLHQRQRERGARIGSRVSCVFSRRTFRRAA